MFLEILQYMHPSGRPGKPGLPTHAVNLPDRPAYAVRWLLQLNTGPCSFQY